MRKRGAALWGGGSGWQEEPKGCWKIVFLREKISIPKRAPGSKSKQVSLVIVLYCALGQA